VRADRLLAELLLLRHRGRMSATELAAELECSVRTVFRDMEALSAAGIPVYAERGRAGGFALLKGYSTDLTGLTSAEATALITAGSRATSTSLGMAPALASAMRKLVAAMPEPQRRSAQRAGERVLIAPDGWHGEIEPAGVLPVVSSALFTDRRLKVRCPSGRGPARWRTVDPVGLVHAGNVWYLLATSGGADHTYRVSRIAEAVVLDEPAVRGDDVDLEQAWQQRRASFRAARPPVQVQVRVRARDRGRLVRAALDLVAESPDTEGWLLLDLVFGDEQHAHAVLWGLAPDVEVLHPPGVRDVLAARAERTARSYHPDDRPAVSCGSVA